MIRTTLIFSVLSLGLLACTPEQNTSVISSSKTVSLEVSGNQVILLDNKEVHIDYLNPVLSDLKSEFDLSAQLSISADAPMGIVHDVQQVLNRNAIQVISGE